MRFQEEGFRGRISKYNSRGDREVIVEFDVRAVAGYLCEGFRWDFLLRRRKCRAAVLIFGTLISYTDILMSNINQGCFLEN
jgi:hypothetical protein